MEYQDELFPPCTGRNTELLTILYYFCFKLNPLLSNKYFFNQTVVGTVKDLYGLINVSRGKETHTIKIEGHLTVIMPCV